MKNPIVKGWYADPEARIYDNKLYIYVTKSLTYEEQKNLDVVVSNDMETFEVKKDILDLKTYKGAKFAVWAPSIIEKNGKYYIIFAANDIQKDEEEGGLYVGVSDTPTGEFKNIFPDGRALLNRFYNGAQPIDAHFFKGKNGEIYLYYGGWGHLNVCMMQENMQGIRLDTLREITPTDYVEAPFMFELNGKYILMYSSGCWVNGSYCVKTATGNSPLGPFVYEDTILSASNLADGPGHNSGFELNGKKYIVYHRRFIGDKVAGHRVLCIDEMTVQDGKILPVVMT